MIASIDRKAQEQGIISFAKQMKVPYRTYAAQELEQQAGTFTASSFVKGRWVWIMSASGVPVRPPAAEEKIVAKTACDGNYGCGLQNKRIYFWARVNSTADR